MPTKPLKPCRIRQAKVKDLDEVLKVVLSNSHSRSVELIPHVALNLYVIFSAFGVGFTFLIILLFLAYTYRLHVISLHTFFFYPILPIMIIYLIDYISARNLYLNVRFSFYETLKNDLYWWKQSLKKNKDQQLTDEQTLPQKLEDFIKLRQMYLAFAHKRAEDKDIENEGPALGVIGVMPYISWCMQTKVHLKMPSGFERYAQSAVMVSEWFVNEDVIPQEDDTNVIRRSLLEHICGGTLRVTAEYPSDDPYSNEGGGLMEGTSLNYVVICIDELLGNSVMTTAYENGFTLCGKFEDMSMNFWIFGPQPFPSAYFYYIKPMNEVAKALRAERLRRIAMENRKKVVDLKKKESKKKKKKKKKSASLLPSEDASVRDDSGDTTEITESKKDR